MLAVNHEAEGICYYLNNYLSTTRVITDENGVVVWEAKHKPFGEADVNPYSNVVNNFRLPGQYFDHETGLHYNYSRDYHPEIGRYVEPDPLGLRGGINMYAYCMNDPVNMTDPSGQFIITGIIIARVAIGAASGGFAGWVAGMQSGHSWGGIIGGVTGGILGGAIGLASPEMSTIVGGMAGGAVAGAIGGAIGGYTGRYIADPEASLKERLLAAGKGAGIGFIVGTIGGLIGAAVLSI